MDKIGVEGDLNDVEQFPLTLGPISDIEILRTDFNGNVEEVKTLSLPKIKENDENQDEDYFDESNLEEKSSKMESPEIIKGDDSNPESRDSLDRRETEKLQSAPGTLESSGIKPG